jgi:prophage regulatory protein
VLIFGRRNLGGDDLWAEKFIRPAIYGRYFCAPIVAILFGTPAFIALHSEIIMTSTSTPSPSRLLRLPAVAERTACSESRIYELIAEGKLPPPVSIGKRAVAWLESEVAVWVAERIAERDAKLCARGARANAAPEAA